MAATTAQGYSLLLGEGRMIGSEALRSHLQREIDRGALSHAYLIEGAKGTGKHLLAKLLCAALSCRERATGRVLPCGECPACEKILQDKSPDVCVIGKGSKSSIGVDDVRFLRADVLIPPNDLDYKFYIIEDAQDLTAQAQNALLLTLEEPPSYVVFFLLCDNVANILETVRSRAPSLRISPVAPALMQEYLLKTQRTFAAMTPEEQDELLCMAQGSVGAALGLLDGRTRKPLAERRRFAARAVALCLTHSDTLQCMECIKGFGSAREEVLSKLTLMQEALRDLMLLKKSDTAPTVFYSNREEAQHIATQSAMLRLLALYESVERARTRILRNANIRLVLTALLLGDHQVAEGT